MPDKEDTKISSDDRKSQDSQHSTQSQDSQPGVLVPKYVSEKGYSLSEVLGQGAFAIVYKASNKNKPNEPMACKRFDLTIKDENKQMWQRQCLKQEMALMKKLKHPNIVHTYDVFKTRSTGFIFMHFAKDGSIGDVLTKTKKPIEEKTCKLWFGDITKAIEYIHNKGIAHRDLKPDNFLLDDDKKKVLLSDFGFSVVSFDPTQVMRKTGCGTDCYKAPEVYQISDGHVYDAKKTDMYSLGVSLFEMLNHNMPFSNEVKENDKNFMTIYFRAIQKKKFFYNKNVKLSKPVTDLLERLLEYEPNNRIKIEDVVKHKWLTSK